VTDATESGVPDKPSAIRVTDRERRWWTSRYSPEQLRVLAAGLAGFNEVPDHSRPAKRSARSAQVTEWRLLAVEHLPSFLRETLILFGLFYRILRSREFHESRPGESLDLCLSLHGHEAIVRRRFRLLCDLPAVGELIVSHGQSVNRSLSFRARDRPIRGSHWPGSARSRWRGTPRRLDHRCSAERSLAERRPRYPLWIGPGSGWSTDLAGTSTSGTFCVGSSRPLVSEIGVSLIGFHPLVALQTQWPEQGSGREESACVNWFYLRIISAAFCASDRPRRPGAMAKASQAVRGPSRVASTRPGENRGRPLTGGCRVLPLAGAFYHWARVESLWTSSAISRTASSSASFRAASSRIATEVVVVVRSGSLPASIRLSTRSIKVSVKVSNRSSSSVSRLRWVEKRKRTLCRRWLVSGLPLLRDSWAWRVGLCR